MTNIEFANKVCEVATKYSTLYVKGCFGAPMSRDNQVRYINHDKYNSKPERVKLIEDCDKSIFGFDCVCLIKGILWGWNGNHDAIYGGAKYLSNNVPDIGANEMITRCDRVSADFSNIIVGEVVWIQGHIGVYIGEGKVVECTPSFDDGVCISKAINIVGNGTGYRRKWKKHGKLPWVKYVGNTANDTKDTVELKKCRGVATFFYSGYSKQYRAKIDTEILHHGFRAASAMVKFPKGSVARCYGYYTVSNESGELNRYLYIMATVKDNGKLVNYLGFVPLNDLEVV